MNYFFNSSTVSNGSQYQDTAFFQNGQTSKASIFDQPAQSQSQLAYNLFNVEFKPEENRERSIISKLELIERVSEEAFIQQTSTPFPFPSNPPNPEKIQSQESRVTFGARNSKLKDSKAEESKDKVNQKPSKGLEFLLKGLKLKEPSSYFSIYQKESTQVRPRQPQSMPLKFEEKQDCKKIELKNDEQKFSSISIDFQQICQRNIQQGKTIMMEMKSQKLDNEVKIPNKFEEVKSQILNNNSKFLFDKPQEKESHFGGKEKKFELFNLRRSRVNEQNKQHHKSSILQKFSFNNTSASIQKISYPPQIMDQSIVKQIFVKKQPYLQLDNPVITLFKSNRKQEPQKKSILSNAKAKEQPKKSLFSLQPTPINADKIKQPPKNSESLLLKSPSFQKESTRQQLLEKDSSASCSSNQASSKQKRESIGLKQQLKKLTSRPTQKIELKSLAFGNNFKFKPKLQQEKVSQFRVQQQENNFALKEKKQRQILKQVKETEGKTVVKKSLQSEQRGNPVIFLQKQEKTDYPVPVKSNRPSQLTRYMLIIMELQKQSQFLLQRSIKSRNSYRELAILNEDINRRIDDTFNKTS